MSVIRIITFVSNRVAIFITLHFNLLIHRLAPVLTKKKDFKLRSYDGLVNLPSDHVPTQLVDHLQQFFDRDGLPDCNKINIIIISISFKHNNNKMTISSKFEDSLTT